VRPLSQADLPALLAHLSDDPDQLLAGTGADRPVVAMRVRASVGRPGGSAQARWRRLRAAEWAVWIRTVPWRVAAILGIGAAAGLVSSLLAPRLGLVVGGLAAIAAGWGLRFRPSPEASAWRRGAAGERRTARLLGPLQGQGWVVLHDLAVPGSPANIDHLVIGPGGVFVIDSKQYRGRLQLDPSGRLWHGRYPLAPSLRAVSFEADQAAQVLPDPGVVVLPVVAVHGAQVPWGKLVMEGVPVVAARRLPSMLRALPPLLGPERIADQAEHTSRGVHSLELVDRDRLNAYLTAIDDLEHQGDQLHRRVLARLYDFTTEHPAQHVLRWKDITDGIEQALDELAHVAHTVEGIILKHA
jgi:hypothetical protein